MACRKSIGREIKNASLDRLARLLSDQHFAAAAARCSRPGLVQSADIIADSLSGVSGAGRKVEVDYLFAECNESARPYGIPTHRHLSEIEEQLSAAAGEPVVIQFSPHLDPRQPRHPDHPLFDAGRAFRKRAPDGGAARANRQAVTKAPMARNPLCACWTATALPDTKNVAGANVIEIAWRLDPRTGRLIVISALDNLTKGASGQAVQSMNILLRLSRNRRLDARRRAAWTFAANLNSVRQRIAAACDRAGRDPGSVTLLTVSKGQPAEVVRAAARLGSVPFWRKPRAGGQGQNRPLPRPPALALDRPFAIQQMPRRRAFLCHDPERGQPFPGAWRSTNGPTNPPKRCPCSSRSTSRANRANSATRRTKLLADLPEINALPRIEMHGLMTVAPFAREAEKVRPVFRRLRELKRAMRGPFGRAPAPSEHGHERRF